MKKTAIVIGGGPAGMIACGTLSKECDKVILIEKNKFLGKKLRITGKGRCNITNNADIEEFINNVPTNPRFLYSAFYSFTNMDIISLLESLGVKTKVERGERVFPQSDSAKEVADALKKYALSKNVTLINDEVIKLLTENNKITGVKTKKDVYKADYVILATGGCSYPLTGSDGGGYELAKSVGHSIITPKPSLIPIVTNEKWVKDLMGLSLKNIEISVFNSKNKKIYSDFGEMLFTHFGVSGPVILSASAHMKNIDNEKYIISIDLKPALDFEKLDKRICRDFEQFKNKHIINALDELLPKALIPLIIRLSNIPEHKEVNSITKEERHALIDTMKNLKVSVKEFRPIEEAIITSGGIKVSEINPSTMESKITENLYFAGEVIDVDAYTGGFNLQIAYSTGYLAAMSIIEKLRNGD
ncbi:MAG: NAD(P)/FAD-dependent oxidoreductase [Clostridia bacterium]|nr:NAD(P)/FAD-dependent oxidoreductase [Clostridia bacterium]